jgi:hypothetical protein
VCINSLGGLVNSSDAQGRGKEEGDEIREMENKMPILRAVAPKSPTLAWPSDGSDMQHPFVFVVDGEWYK